MKEKTWKQKLQNYRIDLSFHDYKLAVEVDEGGHKDRNQDYEKQREELIKKDLGCIFIRINPDEEGFKISRANDKIFRYIQKSIKKSTKTLMVEDLERTKVLKQL